MRYLLLAALALAGCANTPPPRLAPDVIRVPVRVYVPVPEGLTIRCPWRADLPPSMVFEAAAERRRCLEQYEAQLTGVKKLQGTAEP